jgi:hypothetical protein
MQNKPTSTLLFHLSNELKESIAPISDKRPAFYWFNDSYHSHIPGETPAYKYMYFFIIKPNSGVGLFTRHGKGDFASLWSDYSSYLEARSDDREKSIKRYLEPAIVMSFSELKPVIAGRLSDNYKFTVIHPSTPQSSFSLIKDGQFRNFGDIPELVLICQEIKSSVPIIHPEDKEIRQHKSFWAADTANEGRSWL